MKRRSLTPMLAGLALALSLPAAAFAASQDPMSAFQLAQAQDSEHAGHMPPPAPPAPPPPPAMGMGGMMGMNHDGMMNAAPGGHPGMGGGPEQHFLKMCETADAHHAAMLAFAEVRLKITEAQKPAWAKFAEATKVAHQAMTKLCTYKDKPAPTTLPERLARAEQFAAARLTHLQTLRPAVDDLYTQLTPEQRKLADDMALGMDHHGHHPAM